MKTSNATMEINCGFYRKGGCKYGAKCKYKHEDCLNSENCKEKDCMLGHPTPSCKFYKLEKCERGKDCKFKHEDCTNDNCNSADCKLAHPNGNKRTNMVINPISVDSTFNSHRPEKRMKTTCPTLPATLLHDSNSEDVLQPQAITASSENKNKRKWRKHTSKETRERIKRREEKKKTGAFGLHCQKLGLGDRQ